MTLYKKWINRFRVGDHFFFFLLIYLQYPGLGHVVDPDCIPGTQIVKREYSLDGTLMLIMQFKTFAAATCSLLNNTHPFMQ